MQRFFKYLAIFFIVALVGAQAVRLERTNPPVDEARTLARMVDVAPAAAAVLERACRDCHSNRTEWPWYSNVAPVSWFVIDHVNHGRSHLNFSEWSSYQPDRRRELLEGVCKETRGGAMPLPSYTWIHWNARLSPADIEALCSLGASAQ
ncbi:MAG TPA: heme-binding domain-containing protein [Vicinamibacterales bacterium]|nr:heme-binding domain-containing protein [Vicinamibacterales bacterium]